MTRVLTLLWHMPHAVYLGLATAACAAVRRWWVQRQQRLMTEESKSWPTYRGRVVAVQAVRDGAEKDKGKWGGLLTYSYIADEVEIGEYRQPFDSEAEADEWVRALRGGTITVAVDPRDQRRSIWIAEEADATRKAAQTAWLDAETAELPVWMKAARMVTLAAAVAGAAASVVIEVRELMAMYAHSAATDTRATGLLPVGAFVCSAIAAHIFAKRFPGSRMGDIGKRFKDPVVKVFLKALGIVEGSLFFGIWWNYGEGGGGVNEVASNALLLTALWGGLFAGATVALWVAGRKLPVQHELAPERRGRFEI